LAAWLGISLAIAKITSKISPSLKPTKSACKEERDVRRRSRAVGSTKLVAKSRLSQRRSSTSSCGYPSVIPAMGGSRLSFVRPPKRLPAWTSQS
jgi:hypothetical protein